MNLYFSMSAYISLYCGNMVEQMLGYHALKVDNVLQKNLDLETEDILPLASSHIFMHTSNF